MVDLKSKIRAKFPRRHSGIPLLTSSSNKSNSSNNKDEKSRPVSECMPSPTSEHQADTDGGGGADGLLSSAGRRVFKRDSSVTKFVGGVGSVGDQSPTGSSRSNKAGPGTGTGTAGTGIKHSASSGKLSDTGSKRPMSATSKTASLRDRLRQVTKQGISDNKNNGGQGDSRDRDHGDGDDEEEDDDDDDLVVLSSPSKKKLVHQVTIAAVGATAAAAISSTSTLGSTKNATNPSSGLPPTTPSASSTMHVPVHQPGAVSSADDPSTAATPVLGSADPDQLRRVSTGSANGSGSHRLSGLSSIDETTTDDSAQPDNEKTPEPVQRRIRLTDAPPPPSSADSITPTPTPTPRPIVTVQTTNANDSSAALAAVLASAPGGAATPVSTTTSNFISPATALRSSPSVTRPSVPPRRQSLLPSRQTTLIRTLLNAGQSDELDPGLNAAAIPDHLLPINATMVTRKIWVKRPGASATLVTINEEDLVDDVREMILRKYQNSLGRQFDAPDLTLRIAPRETQRQERVLGPEEPMARTLDAYFPGGQTVDEALIIDVPLRRTPKESPRTLLPPHAASHLIHQYYDDQIRPSEGGTDYFGPGAVATTVPVNVAMTAPPLVNGTSNHPHTISVLSTGHVPTIPSPGGTRARPYRERPDRPRLGRTHTSSPTILNVVGPAGGGHATATLAVASGGPAPSHGTHPHMPPGSSRQARTHSNASSDQSPSSQPGGGQLQSQGPPPPAAPPLPSPPAPGSLVGSLAAPESTPNPNARATTPPPPRVASPRPTGILARPKKKKTASDHPTSLPAVMLSGSVPPINVLIVEDNIINLRLLEAFVKRLKVRWQTAMDGREAVKKWRTGGFHLVLMDIQLPVMSGLEATREIRRLERMNSIGVFSSAPGGPNGKKKGSEKGRKKGEEGEKGKEKDGKEDKEDGKEGGKQEVRAENGEVAEEDKLENMELFKSPVIIVALTASSLQSDRHEALAAGCNDFLTKVRPPLGVLSLLKDVGTNDKLVARHIRLAGTKGHGMGLHAGPD